MIRDNEQYDHNIEMVVVPIIMAPIALTVIKIVNDLVTGFKFHFVSQYRCRQTSSDKSKLEMIEIRLNSHQIEHLIAAKLGVSQNLIKCSMEITISDGTH